MNNFRYLISLFFILLTTSCESLTNKDSTKKVHALGNIKMGTPLINYQGRIDNSHQYPILVWQGTTVATEFTGDSLHVGFEQLSGEVHFNLNIDGHTSLLTAKNGWIDVSSLIHKANNKVHTIQLFKRSEADVGNVGFLGFKTKTPGKSSTTIFNKPMSTPKHSGKKFLFFGDSITAGACNEDTGEDQWEDFSTHNNALSYGAITSKALNAQYRTISVSGMGITTGYVNVRFKDVWNRIYPVPKSDTVDFSLWQPSVIFINLGENDDSFTSNQGLPFPHNYVHEYISVVKKIRKAYPDSTIAILRGGMHGGANSKRLRAPWNEVVEALTSEDNNIKSFVFDHWSKHHPRVSDHQKMAKELTEWIKGYLLPLI